MRGISIEEFTKPTATSTGAAPMLRWLNVADLVVDPAYQRPILGKGSRNVERIARSFRWSCFSPVVVSPVEGGKFAIIDGQHRTTAAALIGLESVPCQIVIAAREEQAAAFNAINGITTPISRMALHAAGVVSGDPSATKIVDVCMRASVELLRYPVAADKQQAGQTMAVAAIAKCLKRYGEGTLITALQCITETENNKPGALSAGIIKALCHVLDEHREWRDSGLALFEAFDRIDLAALKGDANVEAASRRVGRARALADAVRAELTKLLPQTPRKASSSDDLHALGKLVVGHGRKNAA